MKLNNKIFIAAILFILSSCILKNKSTSVEHTVNPDELNNFEKMGFHKAIITHNDSFSEPCNYLILLTDGIILEPMDLPIEFKIENKEIWIKYSNQRRPSRCTNALPVEITEIRERKK